MDIDKLRAIEAAMSRAPWTADRDGIYAHGRMVAGAPRLSDNPAPGGTGDASGIAALRNLAPELLAVVEAAARYEAHDCPDRSDMLAHYAAVREEAREEWRAALHRLDAKLRGMEA